MVLTTAANDIEAAILVGELRTAGINATMRARPRAGLSPSRVYVPQNQIDQAREVMSAEPMSEDELVKAEEESAT